MATWFLLFYSSQYIELADLKQWPGKIWARNGHTPKLMAVHTNHLTSSLVLLKHDRQHSTKYALNRTENLEHWQLQWYNVRSLRDISTSIYLSANTGDNKQEDHGTIANHIDSAARSLEQDHQCRIHRSDTERVYIQVSHQDMLW
jgi:hypothetical protein